MRRRRALPAVPPRQSHWARRSARRFRRVAAAATEALVDRHRSGERAERDPDRAGSSNPDIAPIRPGLWRVNPDDDRRDARLAGATVVDDRGLRSSIPAAAGRAGHSGVGEREHEDRGRGRAARRLVVHCCISDSRAAADVYFPDRHSGGFLARHNRPAWVSAAVVYWRWEVADASVRGTGSALARVPLLSTARGVGVRGWCRIGARGREDRARPRRFEWLPFGCVRAVQHIDAGWLTAAAVATALARAV
jgi:hypothetical protein